MKNALFPLLSSVLWLAACSPGKEHAPAGPDEMALHIDSTVSPGEDFFHFANGKWFNENPIPPSDAYNGLWKTIHDTINASVRQICENAATARGPAGSAKQKIGDYFRTGMDSARTDRESEAAMAAERAVIDVAEDLPGLMKAAARSHVVASSPLFSFYVMQDDRLSDKYAIFLHQGGLGLPNRDYYFDTDARSVSLRDKYRALLTDFYRNLPGQDEASAGRSVSAVYALEESMARASRKLEDLRDPEANYHKMAFDRLRADYPAIPWEVFMEAAGLGRPDTVIVGQPEYFTALNGLVTSTPLAVWKDYLRFHLYRGLAGYLDHDTYMRFFGFYQTALRGIESPKPRWERVVRETDQQLGDLVGQVYVKEYLPPGTKEKLMEIGQAIKTEFAARIRGLDWMSTETKEKALEKLDGMIFKVGYPDTWKDMSAMDIGDVVWVGNVLHANEWHWNDMVRKMGRPVDRTEWDMQPQTYNAYYNPSNNEIVVPGCNIIVPGYERVLADDAILYSIVGGSTFGHEITHGFDDQGSKYDARGNLNSWWTPEDSIRFYAKTAMIVDQFNDYVVVDSLHVNGEATQGENIADLGGIMMGYEAFKKTKQYREGKSIAGLTPDQRFFLAYALAWMINLRPESLANQVKTDVHAPAKFRVIGPLSNMPEFYAAFNVGPGDFMWRPDSLRIRIW